MNDITDEAPLTGIRQAVESLAGLDATAVDSHADRFLAVHRTLQDALADRPSADPEPAVMGSQRPAPRD